MTSTAIPAPVADRMASLLFEDTYTLRFNRILFAGVGDGELIDAVYRYCSEESIEPPDCVAVTTDPEVAQELERRHERRDLDVHEANLLEEGIDVTGPFDYALGVPPRIDWDDLDDERRREYAAVLSRVGPEDRGVDTDGLYVERSLQFLRSSGRGVFLTDTALKTSEAAAPSRDSLAPLVNDVVDVPEDAFDDRRMIAVVTGPGEGEYDPDDRINRSDPAAVESRLAAAAHETAGDRAARAIMTPIDAMEVYDGARDTASVYFDMFYEDYDGTLVFADADARDGLVGYVSRAELTVGENGPIETHARPVSEDRCLRPAAGIDAVVPALGDHRFCFVGDPDDLRGIVTRYDLNKHPVYHQLYDQFARFEIGLRRFVRSEAPDWTSQTSGGHVPHGVSELVPDRLAMLTLGDLVDVVEELDLADEVTGANHDRSLGDLVDLRNDVAHYQPIVHVMSSRPTDDSPERGAPQLATEYDLLSACLERLETSMHERR